MSRPTGTQIKTWAAKAKGDFGFIFSGRSRAKIQSSESPQNIKDPAAAHQLLNKYSMKIPDMGITLKGVSLAILEFTTTAPTLTPLHVEILHAIHVVLDQAILTKDTKDTNQGPLAPSSNCMARLVFWVSEGYAAFLECSPCMSQRGGARLLLPPTSRLRSVAPAYSYSIPFFLASSHLTAALCANMPNLKDEPDFKGPTFKRERQDLIEAGLTAALAITSLQTIHRANKRKERAAREREQQEA